MVGVARAAILVRTMNSDSLDGVRPFSQRHQRLRVTPTKAAASFWSMIGFCDNRQRRIVCAKCSIKVTALVLFKVTGCQRLFYLSVKNTVLLAYLPLGSARRFQSVDCPRPSAMG